MTDVITRCDWQSINNNYSVSYIMIYDYLEAVIFVRVSSLTISFCSKTLCTWAAREASYFTETILLLNVCRLYFRQKANIVSSSYHVLCASVLECDSKPPQVVSAFMENSAICYCYTQDSYSLLYMCKYTNWDPKAGTQPPDGCY